LVTPERLKKIAKVADLRSRFITLLLDRVSDPHNLAAIVRSMDAFGFQEIHAVESGKARVRLSRRVTRGSDRWVDLYLYPRCDVAVKVLKKRGYRLILAVPPRPDLPSLLDWEPSIPTAFVFGNEHEGISPEIHPEAEGVLTIPLWGMTESLNVSVAVAITLFYCRFRLKGREGFLLSPGEKEELIERWLKGKEEEHLKEGSSYHEAF
jgi:tRNA (guanosine-2'-O-)-methyltransferase